LRDLVVHLFLEQRQAIGAGQAEADRIGPTPADDVAGGENAWTHCGTGSDPIADRDQRPQHPVAVSNRRDAVRELRLRGFEHDVLLPVVILHQGFIAIVHPTVKREMNIRIDKTRDHERAGRVDDLCAARHGRRPARANRGDAVASDNDDGVRQWRTAGTVDYRCPDQRQ
jgi:hypothetical protein